MTAIGVKDGLQRKLRKKKKKPLSGCLPLCAPGSLMAWLAVHGLLVTSSKESCLVRGKLLGNVPPCLSRGKAENIFAFFLFYHYLLPFSSSALFFWNK